MFRPKRILFEKGTLEYEMGKEILLYFQDSAEIINLSNNRIKEKIPGEDLYTQYREGKKTLVVGVKKTNTFQTCKPSAHYQLPLVSGCMGQCEYCYLNTNLGDKPYFKVYVNTEDILAQAKKYIEERSPEVTIFEGAATSDPLAIEPYTHVLKKTIEFFGKEELGRFRFVTKYNDVETLLSISHQMHTEIRFSLNTISMIEKYEHATASRDRRIEAAKKVAESGYPVGFLIAPVILYPNWKKEYHDLLTELRGQLPNNMQHSVTFEIISHRYTTTAKNRILEVYPESDLPMEEENRTFRYGQFGYGKYVYPKEEMAEIRQFFKKEIGELFSENEIKYII